MTILIDHHIEQPGCNGREEDLPIIGIRSEIDENPGNIRAIPGLPINRESGIKRVIVKLVEVVKYFDLYGGYFAGFKRVFVVQPTKCKLGLRFFFCQQIVIDIMMMMRMMMINFVSERKIEKIENENGGEFFEVVPEVESLKPNDNDKAKSGMIRICEAICSDKNGSKLK